jgi:two-component system KDP operon response regulator KdpE
MVDGSQILVIDDEAPIRRLLRIGLEANGYGVHEAASGQEGVIKVAHVHPDVIILDMGLPDLGGIEVLEQLREWTTTPVIILSVRDADRDKVGALDAGADDYLTKPFSMDELLARLRVALRRLRPQPDVPVFTAGHLRVDFDRRLVTVHGEPVKLTPTEYALLRLMCQHAGKVLTHKQILRAVWGADYVDETHYLRVYFAQLRRKLEDDPSLPKLIVTEPGVGYRLVVT